MSGKLGSADLVASTLTTVYSVPANTLASMNINFVNRGTDGRNVRLAVADAATPTADEYLEFDTRLGQGGILQQTGVVAQAGQFIVAWADGIDISVVVTGVTEAA